MFSAKVELEKRKKRENDMNEVRMLKANKKISEKGTVFTGNALPFLTPLALHEPRLDSSLRGFFNVEIVF